MPDEPPADGLRALAHPLRLRILSLLTGVAMSAAEVARELGETQANVSYHLRRLHAAGLLEVAEEIEIRGGKAKRYRHDPDSGERVRITEARKQTLLAAALGEELKRRAEYHDPGEPGSLTDAEVWIDADTWRAVREKAREIGVLLHDAARPPRTEGTLRISATVSLFRMRHDR